jgi:poly(hydroxyalkanoate) depolymerase family esterase
MGEATMTRARARNAASQARRPRFPGRFRALLVTVAAVVGGTAVLPVAATAATGTLSTGDSATPAGTQHYQLYVPSTYQPGVAMPLVVALHGCTQSADGFRRLTRWDALAEAKGFIVLFPEQDSNANRFKCWNFFQDAHMHRGSGEPAKIAGVTADVASHYAVDPAKIYVTGLSAGGAMASVMGATYPDLFAAIGIGSGCEYAATAACAGYQSADPAQAGRQAYAEMGTHARVMPFIAFQGDADKTVPPVNADQLVKQWLTTDDLADDGQLNNSVRQSPSSTTAGSGFPSGGSPGGGSSGGGSPTAGYPAGLPSWAKYLPWGTSSGGSGATSTSGGSSKETYTVRKYSDAGRSEIAQYWTVHGMSHAWSGGDASQQYSDPGGPDETAAMYAFFTSHPRH